MSELQRIVDSLAQVTRRAVSVHDRSRRLLAFSSHDDATDDIRKESILTRRGPVRGFSWAKRFGIEEGDVPVRVPANPEIAMAARVCAPIRFDGRLLGFLWLVDPDESMSDDALDLVRSAASALGLAIHQGEMAEELERGRERELLRDLLSDQLDVRLHAVDELIESDLLVPSEFAVVLVLRPLRGREGMTPSDTTVRSRLEGALTRGRRHAVSRQALELVRPDHGVLLVTCSRHDLKRVDELGAGLHGYMAEALGDNGEWRAVVGIGDPQASLADSHISYGQARRTAEVCGVLNPGGPVTKWSDLGVYKTLLGLPLLEVNVRDLHPALGRLFESRDSDVWLRTLECYLDLGCDARAAAKALFINRSSLYHRVHRIEQLAGIDLSNGDDRLAMHLGLKLARLSGLLEPRPTG